MESVVTDLLCLLQKFKKPSFLLQVLQLIRQNKTAVLYLFIKADILMEKQGKINDMPGLRAVEKFRQRLCIFSSSSMPRHAGHNMCVIDQPGLFQAADGLIRFLKPMIFLHKGQHIVKAALDPDVEMPDSRLIKTVQIFLGFA